jgi:hypothetical protein
MGRHLYMRFENLAKPAAEKPLAFPDHAIIPNKTITFDDAALACQRACADCKFYRLGFSRSCSALPLQHWHAVSGWLTSDPQFNRDEPDRCGREGKHWRPKLWYRLKGWLR